MERTNKQLNKQTNKQQHRPAYELCSTHISWSTWPHLSHVTKRSLSRGVLCFSLRCVSRGVIRHGGARPPEGILLDLDLAARAIKIPRQYYLRAELGVVHLRGRYTSRHREAVVPGYHTAHSTSQQSTAQSSTSHIKPTMQKLNSSRSPPSSSTYW